MIIDVVQYMKITLKEKSQPSCQAHLQLARCRRTKPKAAKEPVSQTRQINETKF